MTRFVYLVGQPGSGKSTALAGAIAQRWPEAKLVPAETLVPSVLIVDGPDLVAMELGRHREAFSGTDALAMNIMPKAVEFAREPVHPAPLVLSEGDRLASDKYFDAVLAGGHDLLVVWLDCSDDVAADRRKARGSNQNESWVKGRASKARRLGESRAGLVVDATLPRAEVARQVAEVLAP